MKKEKKPKPKPKPKPKAKPKPKNLTKKEKLIEAKKAGIVINITNKGQTAGQATPQKFSIPSTAVSANNSTRDEYENKTSLKNQQHNIKQIENELKKGTEFLHHQQQQINQVQQIANSTPQKKRGRPALPIATKQLRNALANEGKVSKAKEKKQQKEVEDAFRNNLYIELRKYGIYKTALEKKKTTTAELEALLLSKQAPPPPLNEVLAQEIIQSAGKAKQPKGRSKVSFKMNDFEEKANDPPPPQPLNKSNKSKKAPLPPPPPPHPFYSSSLVNANVNMDDILNHPPIQLLPQKQSSFRLNTPLKQKPRLNLSNLVNADNVSVDDMIDEEIPTNSLQKQIHKNLGSLFNFPSTRQTKVVPILQGQSSVPL
jgi:hypothetical protein